MTYEYAGFRFNVTISEGDGVIMTALPGQHSAAYKDKHLRAAYNCFIEDNPQYRKDKFK